MLFMLVFYRVLRVNQIRQRFLTAVGRAGLGAVATKPLRLVTYTGLDMRGSIQRGGSGGALTDGFPVG